MRKKSQNFKLEFWLVFLKTDRKNLYFMETTNIIYCNISIKKKDKYN